MLARTVAAAFLLIASATTVDVRAGAPGPDPDPRDARVLRVEQWLKAALSHTPGEADEAAALVGSWSVDELQALWTDGAALLALMRNTTLSRIVVHLQSPRDEGRRVRYTQPQLQRLRVLACAASGKATWTEVIPGIVIDPFCAVSPALVDRELRELSARADASRRRGDPNFFVRRAAMLHADIAVAPPLPLARPEVTAHDKGSGPGPRQVRINILDGRATRFQQAPTHWMIGRMLLDEVKPVGAKDPAPGRDEMVREWCRASLAWMQLHEDYDTTHLAHGLGLFGVDADILFLAACQREAFAAPRIQTAAHNTEFPRGLGLSLLTDVGEWESAEKLFRRALEAQPNAIGTRVRLGHVLLRLGRYQEAAIELRQAVPLVEADDELRYDGELFLGAAEEQLGAYDASRAAFERAASLYPTAQSPWLALSELARRRGDRPGALRAIDRLFGLPADAGDRFDPWWTYQIEQARTADRLLDGVRRTVLESAAP